MLDIDINFLNFLLNPTYEYIKNDIEIIKRSIIEDAEESKKEETKIKLSNIDFLFLTRISTLGDFLCQLDDMLIIDAYHGLAKIYSLNIENNITKNNTNFITNILIDNNIKYLKDDNNLKILNTSILDYLTNLLKTTSNQNYKDLALKGINYINETNKKYNEITKKLIPYYDLVSEKTNKQLEILENYQRKIIQEYSHLLSNNGQKIINEKQDYDIKKLLEKEPIFNIYFKFGSIDAIWGIDEYISVNDLFNIKRINYDTNIFTKLYKSVRGYNELIKKELEEYDFTITKSELTKYFTNKLTSSKEPSDIIKTIVESIIKEIYSGNTNFFHSFTKTTVIEPLTTIFDNNNTNQFISSFYHLISHELYHALDLPRNLFENLTNPKEKFPVFFDDKFKLIYESYTDYRAITKICNLIQKGNFSHQNFINYTTNSDYTNIFFMLIDLFETYPKEFELCFVNNNLEPLIKILGKKEFENIIKLINNFNKENFDTDLKYATNINKTIDKYQKRAKIRQKIGKIIQK